MPVIRVTKTTNYTVISNYPLRDSRLSLKACALLCKMLCNADTWDYSITGMATQCKDGNGTVRLSCAETAPQRKRSDRRYGIHHLRISGTE